MTQEAPTIAQRLESFKKRWQPANARRERLIGLREETQRQLQELEAQALEQFGVSDLDTLRKMHQEQEARREQLLFEAEMELEQVEAALSEIERQLQN